MSYLIKAAALSRARASASSAVVLLSTSMIGDGVYELPFAAFDRSGFLSEREVKQLTRLTYKSCSVPWSYPDKSPCSHLRGLWVTEHLAEGEDVSEFHLNQLLLHLSLW